MLDFLGKWEVKVIRRLFLKDAPFLSNYLKFRNIFSSKKIVISPLQSVQNLKLTDVFHERYKEVVFKFNFKSVHSSLKDVAISMPAIGYYKLEHAMVNCSSHLFYYQNSWYHQEVPAPDCARWASAGKHLLESATTRIISYELDTEFIEKGIFIGGQFSKNWYHWVIETVSRIAVLKEAKVDLAGYYLCLPSINENLKNHMDLLNFLDLDLEIKYLDSNKYYIIKNAYLIDAPIFGLPDSKMKKVCYSQLPYFTSPDALKDYRQLFLKKMGIRQIETGRRIFLGRKIQKRLYNQDEVFNFFERNGFEIVYCEDLSAKQQIELFGQVDMIVGPTGASWTNILFSKAGCKAFCWAPEFQDPFPIFGILGLGLGVDIRYDFFKVDGDDWRSWKSNGSYHLSEEFLERNFKQLMEK